MNKRNCIRMLLIGFANLGLGAFILGYNHVLDLWPHFGIPAAALLGFSYLVLRKPSHWGRAIGCSLLLATLVPTIGLYLAKPGGNTPAGILLVGIMAVTIGWAQCLLMFLVNSVLLIWYTKY